MNLPARHAVAALRGLGFPRVSESALRQWRRRGHIGRGPGYNPDEIAAYLRRQVTGGTRVPVDNHDR